MHHLREAGIGVSTVDIINLWTAFHDFTGNVVFHAAPAHDDRELRITLFQRACQRHAGQQLLVDNCESHQSKAAPVSAVGAEINELRRNLFTQTPQLFQRAAGRL